MHYRSAVVTRSLHFTLGPGDAARDIGHRFNLQRGLGCTRPIWECCLFEAGMPVCAVGALNPLVNVLRDCQGSRDCSTLICWGSIVPPMLYISTEFGADLSSQRGWAVAVCWVLDGLCGWGGWATRIAVPPACWAGAPLRQALGSKLSLCTYSCMLPCLRCIISCLAE